MNCCEGTVTKLNERSFTANVNVEGEWRSMEFVPKDKWVYRIHDNVKMIIDTEGRDDEFPVITALITPNLKSQLWNLATSVFKEQARNIYYSIKNMIDTIEELIIKAVEDKSMSALEQIKKMIGNDRYLLFVNKVYTSIYLRPLKVLGITEEQISHFCNGSKYRMMLEAITLSPYSVFSIPTEVKDRIAEVMGMEVDEGVRYMSDVTYYIYKNTYNNLNTCINTDFLYKKFPGMKDCPDDIREEVFKIYNYRLPTTIIKEGTSVKITLSKTYLKPIFDAETRVVEYLSLKRQCHPVKIYDLNPELNKFQVLAIEAAVENRISILTGGAGTGKTRCITEIIKNLSKNNLEVAVLAPTGKAVSVIKESFIRDEPELYEKLQKSELLKISTIHSYLLSGGEPDHVIIDESSMLSLKLFDELIQHIPETARWTFVGDMNQIPPLAFGCIFSQIIDCKRFVVHSLSHCFRVTDRENEGIKLNANRMIRYKGLEAANNVFELETTDNFHCYPLDSDTPDNITQLYEIYGIDAVMILSLRRVTVDKYNEWIQAHLNRDTSNARDSKSYVRETKGKKRIFYINDRVMNTQNRPQVNIYNGDIGSIIAVGSNHVIVKFNEMTSVKYRTDFTPGRADTELIEFEAFKSIEVTSVDLTLAYAITVDKAQGSQAPVVIYIDDYNNPTFNGFYNKNRIYTAITRAKDQFVLFTSNTPLFEKTCNTSCRRRDEIMKERLQQVMEEEIEHAIDLSGFADETLDMSAITDDYDYDYDFD